MLHKNELFSNEVKRLLKENKKTVGAWLQSASPISAEIIGKAGLDWVMIDMEHGPGDILTLINQLNAVKGHGTVPFVRAPWNDFITIKRILDAGAYGVLIPYVNTAEEAEAAVAACKYPMEGIRGLAPSPRAGGYGMDGKNYLENANNEITVIIAIETPLGVSNIDEILKVKGLDGIFIGPMDLATSMGHFCNPSNKEVQEAIKKVESKVILSEKFLGTIAGSAEAAKPLYDRGYKFIMVMSDTGSLGKIALENVNEFQKSYPER